LTDTAHPTPDEVRAAAGRRTVIILCGALVLLLALCSATGLIAWYFYESYFANFTLIDTTQTEADFTTTAERIAYLQSFCPVTIPKSATSVTFTSEGFQDTWLEAGFDLPSEDFEAFRQSIAGFTSPSPGTFQKQSPFGGDESIEFRLDAKNLRVVMEYIDP